MSNKLKPTDWRTQVAIFEKSGFVLEREKSSHLCYVKEGIARPVIIPKYNEIGINIIMANMRTASMNRKEYMKILNRLK